MKLLHFLIAVGAWACSLNLTSAALTVSDSAGNYSSWGSTATSASQGAGSGSVGVSGWTYSNTTGSSSDSGSFLATGNQTSISSGNGNAWGLYANGGYTANAVASFSGGNLLAGQTLSIQMQNNSIAAGGSVGFSLYNSSGHPVLEYYFNGGGSDYNINVWQNSSTGNQISTTFGYTSGAQTLSFTQLSNNGWSFSINGTQYGSSSTDGNLYDSIDAIRFFDYQSGGGGNVYFNNLQVVPEPVNVALGCFTGLFVAGGLVRFLVCRVTVSFPT